MEHEDYLRDLDQDRPSIKYGDEYGNYCPWLDPGNPDYGDRNKYIPQKKEE